MKNNWYVISNGRRYNAQEIEQMSVAEINSLSMDIGEQQLATTVKTTSAKVALANGNPIDDEEFLKLRLKVNILNTIRQRLALIKKRKNIEASESYDRRIIAKLREIVGEGIFLEVAKQVEKEI